MPSNTMRISQLVKHLEAVRTMHGDLDVVLSAPSDGMAIAIDTRNLNVAIELPYGALAAPALVIGLKKDAAGVIRSAPGERYVVSPEPAAGGWVYDRTSAPDGEMLIWTRGSGERLGRKSGQRWEIYDGEIWVEIVPDAVLAWRLK